MYIYQLFDICHAINVSVYDLDIAWLGTHVAVGCDHNI